MALFSDVEGIYLIRVCSHCFVGRKKDAEYEFRFEVIKDDCIEGRYKAFTSQSIGVRTVDRGNYYHATFIYKRGMPWMSETEKIQGVELDSLKKRVKLILQNQ